MLQFGPIVCAISSAGSPRALRALIFAQFQRSWLHCKRALKKSAGKKEFRAWSESFTLRAILGAKIDFLACFF